MATSSLLTTIWTEKRTLQHPFHEHALTLRELSKDCGGVDCFLCEKVFQGGPAFCCEDCDFILHEACALVEIPPVTIEDHPYHHHPGHPLHLVLKHKGYRCSACEFSLDMLTALSVQDVEEDGIGEHRLSFSRVEIVLRLQRHLQLYDHEHQSFQLLLQGVCAELLDLEIQHPLHRQHPLTLLTVAEHANERFLCKVCWRTVDSPAGYCCKECGFALHLQCAIPTMHSSSSETKHYFHMHPLTPLRVTDMFQFHMLCKFCELKVSGAEAYACTDCSFFIHKSCAEILPKEILQHPFHPQHPRLVLRTEGSRGECDSCSKDIASDIAIFSCGDCEFNLHRSCALEPLSSIEEGEAAYISHSSHEHPLRLVFFESTNKSRRNCQVCNYYISGVGYGCFTCKGFHLHRSCSNLPRELQHELHPQHPLVLSKPPARHFFCYACQDKHRGGFTFYCAECQLYMGVGCASLNATLKHPRHEHRLTYHKTTRKKLPCSCCGKICGFDFYCCMRCNFGLHRDCIDHLPSTIDHKCHRHPLQLCDKFVYGRPDDQYCDYCEMIRNPDHGVYRCEECDFSAHIECMISSYKEEENGSVTIGSSKSNQLNIEIASVRADMETKRRDLEAMEANLEISLDVLKRIKDVKVDLFHGRVRNDIQPTVQFFPVKGLKSIFHEHPLTLRIISDNCEWLNCHLCRVELHGPCYCCEACDFFLHGQCAVLELSLEIQHPYHLNHPLTLQLGGTRPYYSCGECKDSKHLDALTAFATLPPRDDEELNEDGDEHNTEEEVVTATTSEPVADQEIIRHFSHIEHPLVSFHVETQLSHNCGLCDKPISGRFYGCSACIFLLHASCVVSPRVIHHHPFGSGLTLAPCRNYADEGKCRICADDIGGGFVYCHRDGSGGSIFTLHMACALSTGFPRGQSYASSAEFKVHPCPLVFFHVESGTYSPVRCEVCELKISGEALGCPKCRFTLHKSCARKLQEVIHHFLHPEHSLKLMEEPGNGYRCGSCQQSYYPTESHINMVFRCDICEFYLHPHCALQTLSAIEEGATTSISHFTHQHPLQLLYNFISGDCVMCGYPKDGLAYSCPTCQDTRIHKSCAELSQLQELNHPYHPEHLLVLSKSPVGKYRCSFCHEKLWSYAYSCAMCEFYLDFECAARKLKLKHPRHEHRLAYIDWYVNCQIPCNACGKTCMRDLYRCVLCDFVLHYDCLPLPPMIKHEGHRLHPLFLKDKFVDGDPDYQYCDHCETLRNPEHGVYHCGECWFSAHIDCMISKDKVEEQEKEPEVVLEAEERKVARLAEVIDLTRMNIDTMKGSLEALTEKLRELEVEKESLSSP